MDEPQLAPRRALGGIVAVWVVALLAGIAIGIFVVAADRATALFIAMGGCIVLSFAVQLGYGQARGFTQRVALSTLGALLVMGIVGLGFGLASVVPG